MDLEHVRDLLPRYTQGMLSLEESLQVSQALARHPELLVDLRLCLELRQAMQAQEQPLPAFPQAVYQKSPNPVSPLAKGMKTLKDASRLTRSALRAALRLM